MRIEILENDDLVAQKAASVIAEAARRAVTLRGQFTLAVSGGRTPWKMLRKLAAEDVPWEAIHIFQVDERLAPEGHPDRNLTHLLESLSPHKGILTDRIHAMPVEEHDIDAAAAGYALTVNNIAGIPAIMDLIHLGLGSDGHTASLVPGDPVLEVTDRDVAPVGIYQGRRRLTFTYPLINRAREILWLVTGSEKSEMLQRMLDCDLSLPAGRIFQGNALLLADKEAASKLTLK